jgi:hypothetical protein
MWDLRWLDVVGPPKCAAHRSRKVGMDAASGDGMQDAVDELAAVFGQAVLIEDRHLRALLWSDQDRADEARRGPSSVVRSTLLYAT